ncbi:hypothetical protein J3D55_004268 [Chryseobacterium ginsenosidimutans]|uniref:hypothetical protein n=1 Tax=Chryseobacterium ginsenosidimutans TaxID=687846 RepID=UPI002168A084|nr:hypothetical protein [Chryseobacterium ginsenosidimutans]MCS3871352.1 hypothetical protein [Chryseobacterium ginsenosidimutans]
MFFSTLIISFLSVQKINAQEKKKFLNRNILTEVRNIQKRFSDSIGQYDYKKDSALYRQKYRAFYGEKIKNLENLYQNIYDKEVMIGKMETTKEISSPSQLENSQQLQDLQKRLTADFPVYLIEDYEGGIYRCNLNFMIDIDGKFKNVKYKGASDTEFGIISALFLYAIGGLEKPLIYNKKPIVQNFAQPIVLRFE